MSTKPLNSRNGLEQSNNLVILVIIYQNADPGQEVLAMNLNVLSEYLIEEKRRIEYWRWSETLKGPKEFNDELAPGPFVSTLQTPTPPDADVEQNRCWDELVSELDESEPFTDSLNATVIFAAAIVGILACLTLWHFFNLFFALLGGCVVGGLIGGGGIWLTTNARNNNIQSEAEDAFDDRFAKRWKTALANSHARQEEYAATLRKQQASWDAVEKERIAILRCLIAGDVDSTKSAITRAIESEANLDVDHLYVNNDCNTDILLKIPDIDDVVSRKSKQISEKSGKIINRTRPKAERELDFAIYAAGTALSTMVEIFNAAPACNELRIALFSDQQGRKAFHVTGTMKRQHFPMFNWETVVAQDLLVAEGFKLEGGKAKKHTLPPEWAKRLQSVQIGTAKSRN